MEVLNGWRRSSSGKADKPRHRNDFGFALDPRLFAAHGQENAGRSAAFTCLHRTGHACPLPGGGDGPRHYLFALPFALFALVGDLHANGNASRDKVSDRHYLRLRALQAGHCAELTAFLPTKFTSSPMAWIMSASIPALRLMRIGPVLWGYALATFCMSAAFPTGRIFLLYFVPLRACAPKGKWGNRQLVLGGSQDVSMKGAHEVFDTIQELELENVVLAGHVHEQHIPGLYAGAAVLVIPSLYEGFGLPVLEAMAAGTPVVSSNSSSLPEVAADAAILFPPEDELALTEALADVLENRSTADELRRAGLDRARQFSWQRTAEETVAVYRACVRT